MENTKSTLKMIANFSNGCDESDSNYHEESLYCNNEEYHVLLKRGATRMCPDCNEEYFEGVTDVITYTDFEAFNWLVNHNFTKIALELFEDNIGDNSKAFLNTRTIFKIKTYDTPDEFYAFLEQGAVQRNGFLLMQVLDFHIDYYKRLSVKNWHNIGFELSDIKSIKPAGKLSISENTITGIAPNQAISSNKSFEFLENQISSSVN